MLNRIVKKGFKSGLPQAALAIFCAFVFARGTLFGEGAPFAVMLVGSLTGLPMLGAFLGGTLGFLTNAAVSNTAAPVAAMLATGAFRLIFCWKRARWSDITSAVIAGSAVFFLGMTGSRDLSVILLSGCEGIIAGTGTAAFAALFARQKKSPDNTDSFTDSAALFIAAMYTAAALSGITAALWLNPGLFAGVCMILAVSHECGGGKAGAFAGVACGLGMALSGASAAVSISLISGGVLISALPGDCKKWLRCAGMMFSVAISSMIAGFAETAAFLPGILLGSVLFLIMPTQYIGYVLQTKWTGIPPGQGSEAAVIFAERLRTCGNALSDVKLAVEKTADALETKTARDASYVYISAADSVCRTCRHSMTCWGGEYGQTAAGLNTIAGMIRRGALPASSDLPPNVARKCERSEQLLSAMNIAYREYSNSAATRRKIADMRSILTAQLSATGSIFAAMADEFGTESLMFDREMAAKTETILRSCGISDVKAAVVHGNRGPFVEGYGKGKLICGAATLCDMLSASLQNAFDLPEITYNGSRFRMTMYRRTTYSLEYGAFQLARAKERSCGDYYDSFTDKHGHAYAILSDGMGSGSRARIDSAFACGMLSKLLRADVCLATAIDIVNNALLVKSSDESFATLDICSIDLMNGHVDLYKAGGAPTFIKTGRKIIKVEGHGVPLGIRQGVSLECQSFAIGSADMVIMASDGADLDTEWLGQTLAREDAASAGMENIAKTITEAAKCAEEKGREDDISVIAMKLVR